MCTIASMYVTKKKKREVPIVVHAIALATARKGAFALHEAS